MKNHRLFGIAVASTIALQSAWCCGLSQATDLLPTSSGSNESESKAAGIPNLEAIIKGTVTQESGSAADPAAGDKLEAILHSTQTTAWDREQKLGKDALAQGSYEDAQKHFLAAVHELKKTNIKDERLMKSRNALGLAYLRNGDYLDATQAFELAQQTAKELSKETSVEFAKSLEGLANVQKANGQYKKAEALFKEALELRKNVQGAQTAAVAQSLLDLGELYKQQKLYDQAEPVYELALETLNKSGSVPDLTKAFFLDKTGVLFSEAAKMPIARRCFETSVVLKDKHSQLLCDGDPRKIGLVYYRCLEGTPNSKHVFNRGTEIEFIKVKDAAAVATLTAQIYGADWYLLKAEVTIHNQGKTPITALAEQPTLTLEAPKTKTLLPLDSDAIAQELGNRGQRLYERLLHSADFDFVRSTSIGATQTAVLTPFGTPAVFNSIGSWTSFTPDWDARLRARDAAFSALASVDAEGSSVFHKKPAQTTIEPGESATFQIFYPYTKFDNSTLRMLIGNTVLEFPFTSHSG